MGGVLRSLSMESFHTASQCFLPGFQVLYSQVQPQHVFQQGPVCSDIIGSSCFGEGTEP